MFFALSLLAGVAIFATVIVTIKIIKNTAGEACHETGLRSEFLTKQNLGPTPKRQALLVYMENAREKMFDFVRDNEDKKVTKEDLVSFLEQQPSGISPLTGEVTFFKRKDAERMLSVILNPQTSPLRLGKDGYYLRE